MAVEERTDTEVPPRLQHPPKVVGPGVNNGNEVVSMKAGLSRDQHTLPKFQVSNLSILSHVMP